MVGVLLCRIGRHRWHQERTEDNAPYFRCQRCGKDRFSVDREQIEPKGGIDTLGGSMGGPG
jgi:hypothetical protein